MSKLICLECHNVQKAEKVRDDEKCNNCKSNELRAKGFIEI